MPTSESVSRPEDVVYYVCVRNSRCAYSASKTDLGIPLSVPPVFLRRSSKQDRPCRTLVSLGSPSPRRDRLRRGEGRNNCGGFRFSRDFPLREGATAMGAFFEARRRFHPPASRSRASSWA